MKKYFYVFLIIVTLLCTACHIKPQRDLLSENDTAKEQNQSQKENTFRHDIFDYIYLENGVEIIKCNDFESQRIVIPSVIDDKPVLSLAQDSFYQNDVVKEICLPTSLIRIGSGTFYRCYSLQSFIIPNSVEIIESNPFFRCSSLKEILVDEKNEHFTSVDGVLYDKNVTELLAFPEGKQSDAHHFPSTMRKIKSNAFGYDTSINVFYFSEEVKCFPDDNMFTFSNKKVLYVKAGSEAQKYAIAHSLQYKEY